MVSASSILENPERFVIARGFGMGLTPRPAKLVNHSFTAYDDDIARSITGSDVVYQSASGDDPTSIGFQADTSRIYEIGVNLQAGQNAPGVAFLETEDQHYSRYTELKVLPADSGDSDCQPVIFLPQTGDAAWAVKVGSSGPRLLLTPRLSGCSLFLSRSSDGSTYALHHVNASSVPNQHKLTWMEKLAAKHVSLMGFTKVGPLWKLQHIKRITLN